MATQKPRITITLEPQVYNLFKALSEAQERPMARIITELLTELSPPLERVLALMQAAKQAPQEVLDQYKDLFNAEVDHSEAVVAAKLNQVDWVTDSLRARGSQPPYINKGVRSQDSQRKPRQGKGSVVSGHFKDKGVE